MKKQKIRIRLKAFDYKLIDQSAAEIVETAIVPGLSFTAKYLRGSDFDVATRENGTRPGDKEWERDLRLDYKVQSGFLKDLGLSLRHASLRSDATKDQDQLRVYLTYNFVLL